MLTPPPPLPFLSPSPPTHTHAHTMSQVRLSVLSTLDSGASSGSSSKISLKSLSASLLPSIQELCSDKAWRVRLATVTLMPRIAAQLGVEFVGGPSGSDLTDLLMAGLGDAVASIREAAAANVGACVGRFGGAWAEGTLLPRILALIEAGRRPGPVRAGGAAGYKEGLACTVPSAQLRVTGLLALGRVGEALAGGGGGGAGGGAGGDVCAGKVLPAVLALAGDAVPNVRFKAAQALESLVRCGSLEAGVVASRVKPVVAKLKEDGDADVRYFAAKVGL